MSLTAYPTLRLKLTMPTALKLQFLPAVPGFNASAAVAAVENKVNRPGDTMTGFLTANADPQAPLHYATKGYVDTAVSTAVPVGNFVLKTGDVMSGDLNISATNAALRLNAPDTSPTFIVMGRTGLVRWSMMTLGTETGTGNVGSDIGLTRFTDAGGGIDTPFNLSRSTGELTLTKPLTLPLTSNPTLPQHAATKKYVDDNIGSGSGGPIPGATGLFVFKDATNGVLTKAIIGSDLPTAQNAALGAVKAKPAVTGQLLKALAEDGNFLQAAPTPADLAVWGVREKLTANRTYYVATAANGGSDSNNGLQPTVGTAPNGPFLTIQKGIDTAVALDLSIFNCSVRVLDGTYITTSVAPAAKTAMVLKSYVGAGPISIVGNTVNPQNVIIDVTQGDCVNATNVLGVYNIAGFTFIANTAGYNATRCNGGATNVAFQDIRWGTAQIHVMSDYGSQVFCTGKQEIFGDCLYHWNFTNKGIIQDVGKAITLTGTRSIYAFAYGAFNGLLIANQLDFVGPVVNGQKFLNASLAIINTGAADLNAFPGSVPGTTWSGGYF
jgi:hypothetical protein